MAYFTESQLRAYRYSAPHQRSASRNIKSYRSQAKVSIFLSHSHQDKDLVEGYINYLGSLGIEIYVDWQDASTPQITSGATARHIKQKIRENMLFMLLATKNAMNSKWVPWETGVADEIKGESNVFIIPVADPQGRFHGSEYLQLYRRVIIADDGNVAVFEPNEANGIYFENVLRSKAAVLG